tara:strand:- start:4911 stop:5531 length:621 start_codon:yes stop_codon:yes gene_type:complete
MSIVAMKRKSRGMNQSVSSYGKGFSLNGGHRNQGWVGQSSLGRSNSFCSANNPNIIKRSNMNTNGYITTSIRNPTSVFHNGCTAENTKHWVQTFNEYDHSQSGHIDTVHITATTTCGADSEDAGVCNNKCKTTGVLAVGESATGAISSSDYMKAGLLTKNCLPTPKCKAHWPQWVNHNSGCNVNYTTPGGGFPADWNWGDCTAPYY